LCKKHGADLMFTEFISSEGLIRKAAKGMKKLDIFPEERPSASSFSAAARMPWKRPPASPSSRAGADRHQLRLPRAQGGEQGRRRLPLAGRGQDGAPHRKGGEGREAARDREDPLGLER
jgi:hypothetical protein